MIAVENLTQETADSNRSKLPWHTPEVVALDAPDINTGILPLFGEGFHVLATSLGGHS